VRFTVADERKFDTANATFAVSHADRSVDCNVGAPYAKSVFFSNIFAPFSSLGAETGCVNVFFLLKKGSR